MKKIIFFVTLLEIGVSSAYAAAKRAIELRVEEGSQKRKSLSADGYERKINALNKANNELSKANNGLAHQLLATKQDLAAAQERLELLAPEEGRIGKRIEKLEQDKKLLGEQLLHAQQELEKAQKARPAKRQKGAGILEEQNKMLTRQLFEANQKTTAAKQEAADAQQEVAGARRRVGEAVGLVQQFLRENDDLKEKNEGLEQEVKRLRTSNQPSLPPRLDEPIPFHFLSARSDNELVKAFNLD